MRFPFCFALITFVLAKKVQITILHTNDVHGYIQQAGKEGGMAYVGYKVNNTRERRGNENVLLVDAGDVFFASPPISELLDGNSTLDIFNRIGYNVSVIGNHEFDKGVPMLAEKIKQSNFKWLGANVVDDSAPNRWQKPKLLQDIHPFTTFNMGPPDSQVVVCVIGACTEETAVLSRKKSIQGIHFNDITETLKRYAPTLQKECDIWFPIIHMGTRTGAGKAKSLITIAQEAAEAGLNIPFIIGGHQNQVFTEPFLVPNTSTKILVAGFKARYLGDVTIEYDTETKKFDITNYQLTHIERKDFPTKEVENTEIHERIHYWTEQIKGFASQVIGKTYVNLNNGVLESTFSDLIADGMLWWLHRSMGLTDVKAFLNNAGSVRDQILIPENQVSTKITFGKLYQALPFDNPVVVMDLKGEDIYKILYRGATLGKKMIQVSGITFEWWNDMNGNVGIRNIRIGGEELSLTSNYRIGTSLFLAEGGDNFEEFLKGRKVVETNEDIQKALRTYIEKALNSRIRYQDIPTGRSRRIQPIIGEKMLVSIDSGATKSFCSLFAILLCVLVLY